MNNLSSLASTLKQNKMESIQSSHIIQWLEKAAVDFRTFRGYLTELDSPIGDADHGINMDIGFTKVLGVLPTLRNADIGTILKTVGMTLSTVDSASGLLYSIFFLEAGKVTINKRELSIEELLITLRTGVLGVKRKGKALSGDKTMIDTFDHALISFSLSLIEKDTLRDTLMKLVAAAVNGMKMTIGLLAQKGKASYVGERSIGHQDPGATSTYILLACLCEAILDEEIVKEITQTIQL